MIKAIGHLLFCSGTCFGELRGTEILPSQSFQHDLESVVSVHSVSERQLRNESFLSDVRNQGLSFFFCLTFYLPSEGVWCILSMVEFAAESLPYNECNFILIRNRLILSLNHQNEDWQMIPYLSTNLLCDFQQTPQLCAAVPRSLVWLCCALVELGAVGAVCGWYVPEADPTIPPCQQCSVSSRRGKG